MELQKIMYVVAYAVELTGIAIIVDAYLVKKNGKNKIGFYILLFGIYLELLSMFMNF